MVGTALNWAVRAILPLLVLTLGAASRAQTTLYDATADAGDRFSVASAGPAPAGSDNVATTLLSDDIAVGAGFAGATVTGGSVGIANTGSAAFAGRLLLRFYAVDPATGNPGAVLGSASQAESLKAFASRLTAFSLATPFVVPANGRFWAGLAYDNAGGFAGAGALPNMGAILVGAPTLGMSSPEAFETNVPSSSVTPNPAGSRFSFTGGAPANFAWRFTGSAPVPEPAALAALGFGALVLLRRRGTVRSR